MTFRDDVDALYQRATVLQRELDRSREELARTREELARSRGDTPFADEPTSPALRALRTLPDPDDVLARLDRLAWERLAGPSDAAAAPPRPVAAPTAPPPPLVPVELHMIEEMAPVEPIRQQLARVVMALDDDDARRTLYLVECLLGDDDAQRDWRLVRIVDDLRQL